VTTVALAAGLRAGCVTTGVGAGGAGGVGGATTGTGGLGASLATGIGVAGFGAGSATTGAGLGAGFSSMMSSGTVPGAFALGAGFCANPALTTHRKRKETAPQ